MTAPIDAAYRERIETLERMLYELRQQLAASIETVDLPEGSFHYLTCRVGEAYAALPLDRVEEVVPMPRLEPLPEAPAWVAGVINLRGESLPVLDVSARISRCRRDVELSDLVVVCVLEGRSVGLVVQDVYGVEQARGDEIQDAGEVPHAPYLLGVLERADHGYHLFSLECLVGLSDIPEGEE